MKRIIRQVFSSTNFTIGFGVFAAILLLVILAVGPTVGGYGLYTLSLSYLPASVANLIATLEPAMTAGLAYLFLGEDLNGIQLLGSILIVSGVFILRLRNGRGRKTAVH